MKDYYYILGISKNATQQEIKKAYKKLSLKFHPDKNSGDTFFEERFKEIQEAYEVLGNVTKRGAYNFDRTKYNSKRQYQSSTKAQVKKPQIISFDATKYNVGTDESVTIFWATVNCTKIKITHLKGELPLSGKRTIKFRSKETKDVHINIEAFGSGDTTVKETISISYFFKKKQKEKEEKTVIEEKANEPSKKEKIIEPKRGTETGLNSKPLLWILSSIVFLSSLFLYSILKDSQSTQNVDGIETNLYEKLRKILTPGSAGSQALDFIEGGFKGSGKITFKNIQFATGSSAIAEATGAEVDNLATMLKTFPDIKLAISGYTDDTGLSLSNTELSKSRADAVKARLISQGIEGNRMSTKGFGSSKPVATNDTALGRARNRRIEAIILNGSSLPSYEKDKTAIEERKPQLINVKAPKIINPLTKLTHGVQPYSYCYKDLNNSCNNNCSQIEIKASCSSDVIGIIKKNNEIVRNAYIKKCNSFVFEIPNGSYQTFFYYGEIWNNDKYIKSNTPCGDLYGGFTEGEVFAKGEIEQLSNQILKYELIQQINGNFSQKTSDVNQVF